MADAASPAQPLPAQRRPDGRRADDPPIPRAALIGCGLLMLAAIVVSAIGSYAGWGRVAHEDIAPAASRVLIIETEADGAVTVRPLDGAAPRRIANEQSGFLRGVMRTVARERTLKEVALDGPVSLSLAPSGRLSLLDPTTGLRIELNGFGADNRRAFAALLAPAAANQ